MKRQVLALAAISIIYVQFIVLLHRAGCFRRRVAAVPPVGRTEGEAPAKGPRPRQLRPRRRLAPPATEFARERRRQQPQAR